MPVTDVLKRKSGVIVGDDVRALFMATEATASIWAAVSDPEILIGTFSYLLLKPILRSSGLVDEKKGAYRTSMIWYNVILALFSATSFYVTATALGWDYGSGEWLRRLTGDTPQPLFQCPSRVWDSKLFVWTAKAFYYSKYVEYLDTAWLVLKGKNVSFLQAFHHFGAPWDVYLGIRLQNEGVWIFMFFNSFIHTIMYTYYGLTAAGYKIKAKPLITAMQISQFMGGFILVWDYINIPCFRSDNGKVFSWVFNYAYVGFVFLLFCHFFYKDNLASKKPAKGGKAL